MRVPSPITSRTEPSSQPLVGPQAVPTPETFGAGIGRQLSTLGATTAALGTYVQQQQEQKSRFDALRRFSDFQTRTNKFFAEATRNADPTQANFAEVMAAEFANMEADFINNEIPPELQGEFSVRTAQVGEAFNNQALQFQYNSADVYFRTAIEEAYEQARVALDQDGSVENLQAQQLQLLELVRTSGLSEAEQVALARKMNVGLQAASYKAEVRNGKIEEGAIGVGAGGRGGAMELLREFTGLEDEALQDIVIAAEQVAVEALPSLDLWAAMPDHARAAVISVVAQEGELPGAVANAIMAGDLEEVANTVESLGGDNNKAAAEILRGNVDVPAARLDTDPRYADIPYEDRLALRADADREAAAILTAQQQAETARNKELVNALHVALHDGTAGLADIDTLREMGVLTDVDDIVKAHKLLDDGTNEIRLRQQGQAMIANEQTFIPTSDEHRDVLNAMVGKEGKAALENKDSAYVANTLIPMVRTAQDIPTDVVGMLTGMIRSQDLEKAQWAMDLMSQLQQASPKAYDMRVAERDARDVEFWQARKDYYPADVLMPMVRGGVTQAERAATQQLRIEAAKVYTDKKVSDGILGAVVPFGFSHDQIQLSVPWAARGLEAEFQAAFIDEYSRDGDVERARQAATNSVKRVWGVTNVGGRATLMKYPPERVGYMPIDGNYDWITEQVFEELEYLPGETFELISDEQTREEFENSRLSGEPPSYVVVRVSPAGVGRLEMDESGMPVRMFFQITPEMEQRQLEEFQRKRDQTQLEQNARTMGMAEQHSLETALPIPEEMFDPDMPGGALLNAMTGTAVE